MPRSRAHTRRVPKSRPRGVIAVRGGGFGFVRTAEGEFYVPASKLGGAFDGDVVEVAPLPASTGRTAHDRAAGRPAARVARVVERAHLSVVGRYEVAEPFGVVVPTDPGIPHDIFTQRSEAPDVPDRALVRVRILQYPGRNAAATGVVEEVLGSAEAPAAGIEAIIARHKLETAFSEGSLAEARAAVVDVEGALAAGYRDLTDRTVVTIDPDDARDFDDALSIERLDAPAAARGGGGDRAGEGPLAGGAVSLRGRWRIGVHIADVSHYVPWNSSLDLDARRRATSVYLVDRVVPMLPEELSCDLCSLAPGKVRRAMTVDLVVDGAAGVLSCEIFPSLIRSRARLTYGQVQHVLDGDCAGPGEPAAPYAEGLRALSRFAALRESARRRAGGMEFSGAEAKVRLDAEGRPTGVDVRRKTEATSLVEEMMIWANEVVAARLVTTRTPGLFRVHEAPAPEGLAALAAVFEEFPWFGRIDAAAFVLGEPHALQAALEASAGRPEGELVSSLLLRAMKRAVYRPENGGHFGLASAAYAHFTSPIRRYPDLVVHRMLKTIEGGRPELYDQEVSSLAWIAEHASEMERVADDAARESQELKLIEYLVRFVGQSFPAVVSGAAPLGLYARLENTAEGFIPARTLGPEYFSFDADRHQLVGEDTNAVYRLGQRIAVTVHAADPRTRTLEFRLARGRRLPQGPFPRPRRSPARSAAQNQK